jgi:hypothetical protein
MHRRWRRTLGMSPGAHRMWRYLYERAWFEYTPGLISTSLLGIADGLVTIDNAMTITQIEANVRVACAELRARQIAFVNERAKIVYIPSILHDKIQLHEDDIHAYFEFLSGEAFRDYPDCDLTARWARLTLRLCDAVKKRQVAAIGMGTLLFADTTDAHSAQDAQKTEVN